VLARFYNRFKVRFGANFSAHSHLFVVWGDTGLKLDDVMLIIAGYSYEIVKNSGSEAVERIPSYFRHFWSFALKTKALPFRAWICSQCDLELHLLNRSRAQCGIATFCFVGMRDRWALVETAGHCVDKIIEIGGPETLSRSIQVTRFFGASPASAC